MKVRKLATFFIMGFVALILAACGAEPPIDVAAVTSRPKAFVGSDTCKMCHLEHYDSWKMTMHSRMLQDAKKNQDAIIVPIDEKHIREDLAKLEDKLKVPSDQVGIGDDRPVRPTGVLAARGEIIGFPAFFQGSEVGYHGIDATSGDPPEEIRFAEPSDVPVRPGLGLGDHPDPVAGLQQHPADHGHPHVGAVDVAVAGDEDDIQATPSAGANLFGGGGQKHFHFPISS